MQSVEARISADGAELIGDLTIPRDAHGIVVFAHGSGSGRFSSRNRAVAARLQERGFATLLLDLLTEREDEVDQLTRAFRFDIPMLACRLVGAVDWIVTNPATMLLPVGLFGASTGAAAALIAAADRPSNVGAVVSRGGRPDLAGRFLAVVEAPTLLIVGGRDPDVLALNQDALASLREPKRLVVVPGASHLFEEPGTLDMVASLAGEWFSQFVGAAASQSAAGGAHGKSDANFRASPP